MRVRLSRRTRDERGAVAIMAAGLLVTMLVLAAFVTDFGVAYVAKRQAQTTADAAVLAAAKVYSTEPGACGALLPAARPDLLENANTAADVLRTQNLGEDSTDADVAVTCDLTTDELRISYEVVVGSDIVLGQLAFDADAPDQMTIERDATATFDRPVRGESGMRPWPMCSNSVPADWATNKVVVQVVGGVKDNVGCPGINMSGDWGRFACPGHVNGNGSPTQPTSSVYWVRNGCPNPASPIPNQQPYETSPSTLWSYLTTYPDCQPSALIGGASNEFCLTRDTGSALNPLIQPWRDVLAADQTFEVPMFCAVPQCSADAVVPNFPKNIIPIYQMGVIRLCGFYLKGTASDWSTNPECQNDPNGYRTNMMPSGSTPPNPISAFYVVFEGFVKHTDTATTGGSSNLRLTE